MSTPRTDARAVIVKPCAAQSLCGDWDEAVDADHARTLETELTQAHAELEKLRAMKRPWINAYEAIEGMWRAHADAAALREALDAAESVFDAMNAISWGDDSDWQQSSYDEVAERVAEALESTSAGAELLERLRKAEAERDEADRSVAASMRIAVAAEAERDTARASAEELTKALEEAVQNIQGCIEEDDIPSIVIRDNGRAALAAHRGGEVSDPTFTPADYLKAEIVCDSILQDLAIHFQTEGLQWERDQMQKHINQRAALILVKSILLDAGERLLKTPQ